MQVSHATQQHLIKKNRFRSASWFEKIMALLALTNFALVLFDFSYIALRDFYLRNAPILLELYDPMKGIEPHRDTQKYLDTVDRLEQQLARTGPQGAAVQALLADLREQSLTMVEEDPFQIADKSGVLERIKNRMRQRLGTESSKDAFRRFWSTAYLNQGNWPEQLGFFDRQIRPLIATNYFRPIGENGKPLEKFWRIDIIFICIFGLEFLSRTFYLNRRHPGTTWFDTMLWRWYDIFLLLPFWRLLRIIPVTVRLHQVGWLDLTSVQNQVNRNLAENIAAEVTELAFVRTISLAQDLIKNGAIAQWLTQPRTQVTVNDIDEIATIGDRLVKLTIYRIYPQIQADIEALLQHSITTTLTQLPLYQNLQNFPGIAPLPAEIAQQLAHQLSQGAYETLTHALEDKAGGELFSQLSQHFSQAFIAELQNEKTLQDFQTLLIDLLEETKLTFLRRAEIQDPNQTLVEVEQLRQITSKTTPSPTADLKSNP